MLTLYRYFKNMSNYIQVLWTQAIIYLIVTVGLIIAWDWQLLILGLILGWMLFSIGISICLHKMISHRSFEPKNRLIKFVLLWAGIQSTLGSPIGFAAGHRQHHSDSDGATDPFKLSHSAWHNIKLWFYHFDVTNIRPKMIKDLTLDSDVKLFHNHYWKIWAVYPIILLMINPVYFLYFFAVPVVYGFLGMSYVTVIAHSVAWKRLFNGTNAYNNLDDSWDSRFFSILFAGEGYHHTHHVSPGMYDYGKKNNNFDFSGWLIGLLKR
jgi:stearoyl-CoA desaturase (delta-9 desaturase)